MKIMFRTSGGMAIKKQLGFGHVNRCLSLAKAFRNSQIFFLIEDYGGIKKFMKNKNLKIDYLQKNISKEKDADETRKQIIENQIDILVVDKYGVELSYLKKMKKLCKVVVISDLKKIDYPVDLVINGFIGFKNIIKKNKYGTKCLLGPKFQILNYNFKNKTKNKKTEDLLLTFGGFDENNIIEMVLNELVNRNRKIVTKIILGPSTKKSKNLLKLIKKGKDHVSIINSTSNMKKEISTVKVGLCSGGITTYEFASQGVYFGIICQEHHQLTTAKEWEKLCLGTNLGLISSKMKSKITKFLDKIENDEFSLKSKRNQIIDGSGYKRVSNEILMLF